MEPISEVGCTHNFKMKYRGTSGRFLTRKQYEKRKYFSELQKNDSPNDNNTLPMNVLAQELWCRKCNLVGSVTKTNDSDQIDFNQTCRCCLLNIRDMTPIYDLHSTEMRVAEVFTSTTSLEFSGDQDPLPTKMCHGCFGELNQSYKFVLKCRESDKKLRNHLDNIITHKRLITKPNSFSDESQQRSFIEISGSVKKQSNHSELITETQTNLIELDILKHEIDIKIETDVINNNDELNNARSVPEIQCVDIPEFNQIKHEPETASTSEDSAIERIERVKINDEIEINQSGPNECETTTNQDYQCKLCPKSCKTCSLLKRHHKLHHKTKTAGCEPVKKTFPCAVCGMLFDRKLFLMNHTRIHKRKSPYTCTVCDKPFKQKLTFIRHMNTHTDKKRYCCTVCEASFKYKFSLTCHEETHRKDPIFV